jgi:hypothetical protein
MRHVCRRFSDQHAQCNECHVLYGLRSGSLHKQLAGRLCGLHRRPVPGKYRTNQLRSVLCRISDQYAQRSSSDIMRGLCSWTIQQRLDYDVQRLLSRVGDQYTEQCRGD